MSGFTTQTTDNLIRTDLWSSQLKEIFLPELYSMKYVHWLTDFTDGNTIHIPSLGQAQVFDYEEGQAVRYSSFATGDFTFSIDQYKSSGTYISDKFKQDSYYSSALMATFVPKMNRALMEVMEKQVLNIGQNGQTASDPNTINGADHRLVGSGTGGILMPVDFAKAKYALQKASVPMTNLVAIVDPSVELYLSTLTNLVNLDDNPHWEGIVATGISTGMRFITNIFGFDVYTSQFLPGGLTETIVDSQGNSRSVTGDGVANIFFSAAGGDANPFIGLVRQPPRVETERNKDLQRDEYITTTRYGFGFYRPENFVTVLSDQSATLTAVAA